MAITKFIPELWSAAVFAELETRLVALEISNTDYQGEIRGKGSKVHINSIGDVTVDDYVANTDMAAAETLTDAQQTLEITQAKFFNFQIDDVDNAQTTPKLMRDASAKAAYALAKVADTFVLVTTALAGATEVDASPYTLSTAAAAYEMIVDMGTALDETDTPEDRWIVIRPDLYGLLLKDARFVGSGAAGADSRLATGFVGTVNGMQVFKSNQLTAGNALAGYRGALSFAEQIVEVEAYRPELRFADALKGLHVYGALVTRADNLVFAQYTIGAGS